MPKPRLTEAQRSVARRRAGRRLERNHMIIVHGLREYHETDRVKTDRHWNARRIEAIRSELAATYPEEYARYLKEEEKNERQRHAAQS